MTSTLTDAELVRRCRADDAGAWNELVERYSRYVYAIAVRGVQAERRGRRRRLPGRLHPRSTRASTACATTPRSGPGSRSSPGGAASTRSRRGAIVPAEDVLARGGSRDLSDVEEAFDVREALAGLPDACQDILDRFFARDQSYKTIADELEIPSGTIASRIARCLGRLRNELEARIDSSKAAAKRTPSGIFARPESGASRIPVCRQHREETTPRWV